MHDSLKRTTGLPRLWRALRYSLSGLRAAFKHEDAFRQETVAALVLIPVALVWPVPLVHKALLIGSVFLVLVVELLNSGIEAVVDRISLDRHPLAKRAKDIGSAAVFLSLVNLGIIWLLVLFDWMRQGG
jgi:diacylglycerol kinase (ATP)